MNILGLFFMGRDPAAALLQERNVLVAEEERFVRRKHAPGHFPINAIRFCLDKARLSLREVDYIAVGWGAYKYPEFMAGVYRGLEQRYPIKDLTTKEWEARTLQTQNEQALRHKVESELESEGFHHIPNVRFVPHHLAHAASAYYCSGFKQAAILTLDGHGDENCTVGWKAEGDEITKLFEFNIPNSLGWFYSAFTEFLGFRHKDGEGKLMGLAPCGKPNKNICQAVDRVLQLGRDNGYQVDPVYIFYGKHSYNERYTDELVKLLGRPRIDHAITQRHKDIAFAIQTKLEQCALNLSLKVIQQSNTERLCIAGGVGLNSKMNGHIWHSADLKEIFIQPMSNDAGTALGAAIIGYMEINGRAPNIKLESMSLGPEYSNEQIEAALQLGRLGYKCYGLPELAKKAVELIKKGAVIGWFQGRMECGPRALGNRSILADARDPNIASKVNRLKGCEEWRPRAPSILEERMSDYFIKPHPCPFMNLVLYVKPEKRNEIPGVVHRDGTMRPHSVTEQSNPAFWRLIKEFEQTTGVPLILNTSFNRAGNPIVCTPFDAVQDFRAMKLDALIIGDFLATLT